MNGALLPPGAKSIASLNRPMAPLQQARAAEMTTFVNWQPTGEKLPSLDFAKPSHPAGFDSWTGWYVGANAGCAWGHSKTASTFSCRGAPGSCTYPRHRWGSVCFACFRGRWHGSTSDRWFHWQRSGEVAVPKLGPAHAFVAAGITRHLFAAVHMAWQLLALFRRGGMFDGSPLRGEERKTKAQCAYFAF
jgi:hypothetical protein